ncbi:hypothetical protein [Campylobacter ureolyticus]|uniref:hypothetical protein n=1 Tax=Campylobacter ureolyticus TaxID=827 RepID=UPI001FC828CC|nr:hypothetical protein [Campylobacter ureolyticus]MCZ6106032.1 hypothetical protein [Campylobacter ureolyticus]MCZ6158659.1 hypothetical protein [Campylobacter ureolyticus]GKH60459.1 hypothetical protein CE91St25_07950 [Campylobacter ureolyticus]
MSDDKREKLREYLRNNRPKNRANLGNIGPNNKENSNKNLKNDLNSDNLNLNNNSDLNNSQIPNNKTNSNKRDYDKEPLILKNYEDYFVTIFNLFFASLFFSIALFFCITDFNKQNLFFCIFIISCEIFWLFFSYFFIFNKNSTIHLKNKTICFYKNDVLKFEYETKNIDKFICKSISIYEKDLNIDIGDKIFYTLIFLSAFYLAGYYLVLLIFFIYLSDLFFKLCIYLLTNKKRFFYFPFLIINEPQYPNANKNLSGRYLLSMRHYFAYIDSVETYTQLKKYFLENLNINIDNIKKNYLI